MCPAKMIYQWTIWKLSKMIITFYRNFSRMTLSKMVAISNMWLLSSWNVTGASDEVSFLNVIWFYSLMAYGKWLTTEQYSPRVEKRWKFPILESPWHKEIMAILLIIQEKSGWNTGKLNRTVYEENTQCSSIIFFQIHKDILIIRK